MKKLFAMVAVGATSLAVVACGNNEPKELDSLSYAVGADVGLGMKFGMADFNLDNAIVLQNLEDFYKNGDLEGEEMEELRQRMMEFQYTRFMPYAQAKRMREMVETDCPDTLPALPELFDEAFTREDLSTMMGKNMGASLKSIGEDLNMQWVKIAINEALAVDTEEHVDSLMRLTNEERMGIFQRLSQKKQQEAIAERERLMKENTEESAKWLAEIEKQDGVQKTESGLLYRIDREGDGVQATEDTDVVLVNYEGKTRTGKVFDSSYEREEPISFPLNRVIKGWTEGMKLVKVGGQITLWIPAEMAYGERGAGADIGPNEALEFKVELLDVNPEE